jgi:hypothetical protein
MIIKNYNNYQELDIHKFNKQTFNKIDNKTKKEDVFKDDDIAEIKTVITKLNDYYKNKDIIGDDIEKYKKNLADLDLKNNAYIAQNEAAYENTTNMYEKIFYQNKVRYLENMYKIHNELSDKNTVDIATKTKTEYNKIEKNYIAYKKNIQSLANNTFKREAALAYQRNLELKEEDANIISKNAKDTSFNAYLVFILYICILSAILIIK